MSMTIYMLSKRHFRPPNQPTMRQKYLVKDLFWGGSLTVGEYADAADDVIFFCIDIAV